MGLILSAITLKLLLFFELDFPCLQILGPDSGWQSIPLTELVSSTAVKKAYRKATLFVHPDKLQQRGASIPQKYICEKVFDLLKVGYCSLLLKAKLSVACHDQVSSPAFILLFKVGIRN
jgi:hypothetical protein